MTVDDVFDKVAESISKNDVTIGWDAIIEHSQDEYNAAVDSCIDVCKKEFDYWDKCGGTVTMKELLYNLNNIFEQLKKPLK